MPGNVVSTPVPQNASSLAAGLAWQLPEGIEPGDCLWLWLGDDDAPALTELLMTQSRWVGLSVECQGMQRPDHMHVHRGQWALLNPQSGEVRGGVPQEILRTLRKRNFLVEKARNANIVGTPAAFTQLCHDPCHPPDSRLPCSTTPGCRKQRETTQTLFRRALTACDTLRRLHAALASKHPADSHMSLCAGIVVGTLGVAGYLQAAEEVRRLARAAGKRTYTLLMGKPSPAKLANFPEADIFVMLADAQVLLAIPLLLVGS